jgi:hypothetical protein
VTVRGELGSATTRRNDGARESSDGSTRGGYGRAWRNGGGGAQGGSGGVRLRWRATAVVRGCGGARLRQRSTGAALGYGGTGDTDEETARARSGGGLRRKKEKERDPNKRLKRLRFAFHAMTGCGGRMIGRGGTASGQSPVSS